MRKTITLVSLDAIQDCIYVMRGHRVLLDTHLAALYGVEIKVLIQAVKRNINRFPIDFMFQLNSEEYNSLRSQFVTLETRGRGRYRKYLPFVFTEQGVAMLSGVLHSSRAVEVNIAVMRAFVRMRRLLLADKELTDKLMELENKLIAHDYQIGDIVKAIRKLMSEPRKPKSKIGYLS